MAQKAMGEPAGRIDGRRDTLEEFHLADDSQALNYGRFSLARKCLYYNRLRSFYLLHVFVQLLLAGLI